MRNGDDVEKWLHNLGGATFKLGCALLLLGILLPFFAGCLAVLFQRL